MLSFNATVAFRSQAVLLKSRGAKEAHTRSLGGCCPSHAWFHGCVYPLPARCDAGALPGSIAPLHRARKAEFP